MTKKKKDTYYIYYSLMKTLKYYFVVKENSYSIVLYLSRVFIYISAKTTNAKRVLAPCPPFYRSLSHENPQISPHTNPFHSTLISVTIKWPPPPKRKHKHNKSLSCVTATVARSSLWSIPKRHPTGRFSCRPRKTGNRCYATRNRAIG